MTPNELKAFRKMVKLSQVKMADVLGFSIRAYQLMESGDGEIRPCVGLACASYALGIREYDGPSVQAQWEQNRQRN